MGGVQKWLLLGRLRREIQTMKFLLSFNMNKLRVVALIVLSRRLHKCGRGLSPGTPDIDKRAKEFIAKFYRRKKHHSFLLFVE
ncbi:hypothetical protein AMTRI_Chr08g207370 [Amborella trichopoda]